MASTLAVPATRALRVALAGPMTSGIGEALRRHPVSVTELGTAGPLDAVVLLPGADPAGVYARMAQDGHLLAAVLDLSGARSPRADFSAEINAPDGLARGLDTAMLLAEARAAVAPLPDNEDRPGLTALALSITRKRDLEPRLDASLPCMFDYPLLAGIAGPRALLEQLADAGLLKRHFHERAYLCGSCQSSRMLARDVCVACGGAHLEQQTLIHHYRCGEQAPKSHFLRGDQLVCLKCDRVLRHFGVDYDAPGPVYVCRSCGKTAPEPEARFLCADCHASTRGIDAEALDWYSYSPTEAAHAAVAEGRLPHAGLECLLDSLPGWRTPRDFALTLDLSRRLHARYSRPYAVLRIDAQASAEAMERYGRAGVAQMHQMLADLVRQTVRETDCFAQIDGKLLLLLPETSREHCEVLFERLRTRAAEMLGPHVQLLAQLDEEQIDALIARLAR